MFEKKSYWDREMTLKMGKGSLQLGTEVLSPKPSFEWLAFSKLPLKVSGILFIALRSLHPESGPKAWRGWVELGAPVKEGRTSHQLCQG